MSRARHIPGYLFYLFLGGYAVYEICDPDGPPPSPEEYILISLEEGVVIVQLLKTYILLVIDI